MFLMTCGVNKLTHVCFYFDFLINGNNTVVFSTLADKVLGTFVAETQPET